MKNVAWTWGITLLCALLGIAAMSAMSSHVMRLEHENRTARHEKEHAEKIRLALWRMESEASAIALLENTHSSKNFLSIPDKEKADHVRCYFQYDMQMKVVTSSQSDSDKVGTLRGILLNPCYSCHGEDVSNGFVAEQMASVWSNQTVTMYNSGNAQKTEIQPEFEKSIRAEQMKRNISQFKGGNIQQCAQTAHNKV
jgi:hypothetical protein